MLTDHIYIAFDFETTGLDVLKDEPIQIGLVQFSADGQITNTFQSLIRPEKPIEELKDIVRFLTGFSLNDLQNAPTIEDLLPELEQLFPDNAVVVGHNIGFDVAMLQKYLPFKPVAHVDTFPLAMQLLHYMPSYALDVLHMSLVNKGLITPTQDKHNAHDALSDSFMSYDLFLYLVNKFDTLRRKYLIIDSMIQKSTGLFATIIKRTNKNFSYDEKRLFLPPLKRTIKNSKRIHVDKPLDLPEFTEQQKIQPIDLQQGSLYRLIHTINRSDRSWIVAATHKSKLSIIQRIFESMQIPRSTLHDHRIFDEAMVDALLHKEQFSDDEIGFIAKYFSQFEAGHAQLDTNTSQEYRIINALTRPKTKQSKLVRLTTHQHLWQYADAVSPDDTVLFLDTDWWIQSYGKQANRSFDPYQLLYLLEDITYSQELRKDPSRATTLGLVQSVTIFLGVLSSELNQYFIGHSDNSIDVDFFLDDPRAPKTRALFPDLTIAITNLARSLPQNTHDKLLTLLTELTNHLTGLSTVQKRMYNGNKRYYQFNCREQFVDYEDFIDSLPLAHYYLAQTSTKRQATNITIPQVIQSPPLPQIHVLTKPSAIIKHITTQQGVQNCYIISSSKNHSQQLFKEMMANNIHQKATLVAENITGGVGKNIFHATNSDKPVIAIGGYAFCLALISKKFAFSDLFCYHIFGAMKEQIMTDMLWYAS